MGSFGDVGIVLSLVFGCILLGVVGEIYYLLCLKKKKKKNTNTDNQSKHNLFNSLFWKKPNSIHTTTNTPQLTISVKNPDLKTQDVNGSEPDLETGSHKDLLLKGFGEESVEAELMRLHNLCGPPRFLFTIKEETKEDLESEDGKSSIRTRASRTRSLSDLILGIESFNSPRSKSPLALEGCEHNGFNFNPLFESSTEAEINKLRSSPPPKFKFLRDAEEKLMRRLMEEAEKKTNALKNSTMGAEERSSDGSNAKIIVDASQVLPLASSPSTLQHHEMDGY